MRSRSALLLLLLACAACTQEAAPTSPGEALFLVSPGAGNRLFGSIQLTAANAVHTVDASLMAPYSFYLENAFPPVQGVFQPNTVSSVEDVQLLFGGETVPRVVTRPSENSPGCPPPPTPPMPNDPLCVNSGAAPVAVPPAGSHEVRFDVTSMPASLFSASVGGINENYLLGSALTPSTIFVEEVTEIAQGVFTKNDSNTSLTVTLLVDGVARNTETSPSGSNDQVVVQFQFD